MGGKLLYNFALEDHGIRKPKVGDVNHDGVSELILAQSYPMNREICGVAAYSMQGELLWNHGVLLDSCDWAYSDLPFEIVDWDGDGRNEVVYVKQAYYKNAHMWSYSKGAYVDKVNPTWDELRFDKDLATEMAFEYEGSAYLIVLDGCTGEVKEKVPVPAPADDCIGFGYFDGTGKLNLVAKDRYWNLWAVSHEGKILWHKSREKDRLLFGHYPAIGDIDRDGLDEVFSTRCLIDHDGTILWSLEEVPLSCHHDAAIMLDQLPEPMIVTIADKLRLITADGKILWEKEGGHLQCLYAGRYSTNPKHGPYQFVVQDQAYRAGEYFKALRQVELAQNKGQRVIMYDFYGNPIWAEEMDDQPIYSTINWFGSYDSVYRCGDTAAEIIGPDGRVADRLPLVDGQGNEIHERLWHFAADIFGDSRDELLIYDGDHAKRVNVYTNPDAWNERRHCNHSGFQFSAIR